MSSEITANHKAGALRAVIEQALDDMKAEDPVVIDVADRTTITCYMVIACGRSDRHVQSIADRIVQKVRDFGAGRVAEERSRDWVLLDAGDVIAHVMLPEARRRYSLEKLWSMRSPDQHVGVA